MTVANTLRSGALANTDFRRPDEVLGSLNDAYPMENQNDLFSRSGTASITTGADAERGDLVPLPAQGPALGVLPSVRYRAEECTLVGPARLFVFSDGAYEITTPDGRMLEYAAFEEVLARPARNGASDLDELLRFAREVRGAEVLEDDFSIIRMTI